MRKLVTVSTLAIGVIACGGGSSQNTSSPAPSSASGRPLPPQCPQPGGTYLVTMDRIGGDCPAEMLPPHREQLELVNAPPKEGCQVVDERARATSEGCDYEETHRCVMPTGLRLMATASLQIPAHLREITGRVTYQYEEKNARCLATYNARFRKP